MQSIVIDSRAGPSLARAGGVYYTSPLPVPLGTSPYRTLYEQELRDEEEQRSFETATATAQVSIDFEKCDHPSAMFDELNNTCVSCGVCYGARTAPLTENNIGFAGAHHHTFSSAAASAAARNKRKAMTATIAAARNSCVDISVASHSGTHGATAETRRAVRRLAVIVPDETAPLHKDVAEVDHSDIALFDIVTTNSRASTFGGDSLETRRARFISKIVVDAFGGDYGLPLLSGAYNFTDARGIKRGACPEALSLIASGEETAHSINEKIIGEVYRVVFSNPTYFHSTQRRRLHHLALFAAVVVAHLNIVHGTTGAEVFEDDAPPPEAGSAWKCLELDRIQTGAKPSQMRFRPRAFAAAVSQRLKIKATCTTQLVQEAFSLACGEECAQQMTALSLSKTSPGASPSGARDG